PPTSAYYTLSLHDALPICIAQEPSTDPNAPNMVEGVVKQGTVLFLHSTDGDISKIEKFLEENYNWNFDNSKETKELNLTHNLIADRKSTRLNSSHVKISYA